MHNAPACNIAAIRAHAFAGCHAFDSAAFRVIGQLVADEQQPLAHRAEALHIMCVRGMGLTAAECGMPAAYVPGTSAGQDAEFVQKYVDSL